MSWIRIDSSFPGNAKVLELDQKRHNAAVGLYVLGLCYADAHLTDGRIPQKAMRILTASTTWKRDAEELVRVGLWTPTEDGYAIHDYLAWQRSAAEIGAFSEMQRQKALKKWGKANSDADGTPDGTPDGDADKKRVDKKRVDKPSQPLEHDGGRLDEIVHATGGNLSASDASMLSERHGIGRLAAEVDRLIAQVRDGFEVRSWPRLLDARLSSSHPLPAPAPRVERPQCPRCEGMAHIFFDDDSVIRCPDCNGSGFASDDDSKGAPE
ncbi:MAG: hypothetical protein Q7W51_05765 [Coriobacteriia bacterium]|nr:hypothetical protein [Coriobacteriia bacterium]